MISRIKNKYVRRSTLIVASVPLTAAILLLVLTASFIMGCKEIFSLVAKSWKGND